MGFGGKNDKVQNGVETWRPWAWGTFSKRNDSKEKVHVRDESQALSKLS